MASKTWKLGEVCNGGIIQVQTKGDNVAIINKQWDYSQGTRKGSNQTNAEEIGRIEFNAMNRGSYMIAFNYLHDLTHSYYAEQVLEWIKEKLENPNFFNCY
jgi:hypothetical protein